MIRKIAIVACGFALGFWALALESCNSGRQITMTLVRGLPDKAPTPIFNQGDVLTWTKPDGTQTQVEFDFVSPCKEGVNKMIASCTVNVPSGMFSYTCGSPNICPDPEVPVGEGYNPRARSLAIVPNPTGFIQPVPVYCNTSSVATAAPQVATAGNAFNWLGEGSPQPTWTVTLRTGATGVCMEGLSFNPDNSKCTVQPGHASGTPYTYDLTVTGCGTTSGTGTLTIQ
jgi:hypothetical protein